MAFSGFRSSRSSFSSSQSECDMPGPRGWADRFFSVLAYCVCALAYTFHAVGYLDGGGAIHEALFLASLGFAVSGLWRPSVRSFPDKNEMASAFLVGAGVGCARALEFCALLLGGVLVHQFSWTLLPLFYAATAGEWKIASYVVTVKWIASAVVLFLGWTFALISGSTSGALVGAAWIAARSQVDFAAMRNRLERGSDPSRFHVWTNAFVAAGSLLMLASLPDHTRWRRVATARGLYLFLGAFLHGARFHARDADVLEKDQSIKPRFAPFRTQVRAAAAGGLWLAFAWTGDPAQKFLAATFVVTLAQSTAIQLYQTRADEASEEVETEAKVGMEDGEEGDDEGEGEEEEEEEEEEKTDAEGGAKAEAADLNSEVDV